MGEHQLLICKNGVDAKGIKEVEGFSDKEIKVLVADERKLVVMGSGLRIINFSKNAGELSVCGAINAVNYRNKGEKIIKRLFK